MKVYCKTCRYVGATNTENCWHPDYLVKWTIETWYDYQSKVEFGDCRKINKNNDCSRYEKDKVKPTIWTIMLIAGCLFSALIILVAFGVI